MNRVHRTLAAFAAVGLGTLAACSSGSEISAPGQLLAPASQGDLVGDSNFDYSVRAGLVNVCAFIGDEYGPRATISASASGGTVLSGSFDIVYPECIEVWNATSSAVTNVAAGLVSVTPGFTLERIVTAVGTQTADATFSTLIGVSTASVSVTDATGAFIWFKFVKTDVPPPGGQGCTPGYWKQSQHFGSWTAPYAPASTFASVFGSTAFGSMTLLQVLSQGGGGMRALGRHSVAALLNAASAGVAYDLSAAQVIARFNAAASGSSGAIEAQKNEFDMLNNQGCPLGLNP